MPQFLMLTFCQFIIYFWIRITLDLFIIVG